MKYLNQIFLTLILFHFIPVFSQEPMDIGFNHLEQGRFEEAETFFASYLLDHPDNKTAKICYGRAVGLNGEPQRASQLFADLLYAFPNDFEVQINYNESLLWGKQFQAAKPLYKVLVDENPNNFAAILGYANTLSNLKEFEDALKWINKAIALQPINESAKISRKYIQLGYANTLVNLQDYSSGLALLEEIFLDFPEDKDALLNLANVHLITKDVAQARAIYQRYATTPRDSVTALNGIALAAHTGENDKEALKLSYRALERVKSLKDSILTERTLERHVQALIWNSKYRLAKNELDTLVQQYGKPIWVLALKATLSMYTADFKSTLVLYDSILKKDSTSFDGNLGKANALFASDLIPQAYDAAFKTLDIYDNQKDALGFVEKLNIQHSPTLEEHVAYTFDNGNNIAFANNTLIHLPLSTKFKTNVSYQYRTAENTATRTKANSHVLLAGFQYKLFPKVNLKSVFGLNNSRFMEEAYTQPVLDLKLQLKPFKLHNVELGYQREVQNFNADLIEREIVMNHYGITYNLGTNVDFGWYTQLMHTQQTDSNTRNLLFTSLYYNVLRKPALKLGLNYQYITFKDQVPTIYFSPEKYQAVELFADLRGKISEKTGYMVSAASGLQKVEDDEQSAIFRAETAMDHQFSKRWSARVYAKYSNIASATAAGFEFTEIGLKIKWLITKKPLFFKKIME
ncbi:tetratricopeptide repeat protein [Sediminicola sp. 1XM1-17]|uniref:tetratricopeptide repeat protein n=1 Tax=Sediminicola sp. 1XM1-17 TaxID=3127702 RepID=UPI0030789433